MQDESRITQDSATPTPKVTPTPPTIKAQVNDTVDPELFLRDKKPVPTEECPSSKPPQKEPEPKVAPKKDEPPPPEWTLQVIVRREVAGPLPRTYGDPSVQYNLVTIEGEKDDRAGGVTLRENKEREEVVYRNNRHRKYRADVTLGDNKWEVVKGSCKLEATLDDGGKDTVEIVIRPLPWVRVKVVDEKNKKIVPDVTFKIKLPDNTKPEFTTTDSEEPLGPDGIKDGNKCKVTEMSHKTKCLVVVGIS